jgi:ankyrin repeat protein
MFIRPITKAIEANNIPEFEAILNTDNFEHISKKKILETVAKKGFVEMFKRMISHPNIHDIIDKPYCEPHELLDKTPLERCFILACKKGHLEFVTYVDSICEIKLHILVSAFSFAADKNHIDIVRFLLKKRLELQNSQIDCGNTSIWYSDLHLQVAAASNDEDLVRSILKSNPKVDIDSAYLAAATKGRLNILKILDVDNLSKVGKQIEPNHMQIQAFNAAAKKGHIQIIMYLRDRFDMREYINSAFVATARGNQSETTEYFISIGADVTHNRDYALLNYAYHGNYEMCKKLFSLRAGASCSAGMYMTNIAHSGNVDVFKLFLENNLISMRPAGCNSMLQFCAYHGHYELFKFIVEKCDVDLEKVTRTILMIAIRSNSIDIVGYILSMIPVHNYLEYTNSLIKEAILGRSIGCLKSLIRNYCYADKGWHLMLKYALEHQSYDIAEFIMKKMMDPEDFIEAFDEIQKITTDDRDFIIAILTGFKEQILAQE